MAVAWPIACSQLTCYVGTNHNTTSGLISLVFLKICCCLMTLNLIGSFCDSHSTLLIQLQEYTHDTTAVNKLVHAYNIIVNIKCYKMQCSKYCIRCYFHPTTYMFTNCSKIEHSHSNIMISCVSIYNI